MQRILYALLAVWMLVGVVDAPVLSAKTAVYCEHTNCANGFQDAYVITEVDGDFGCIIACYGIGCDGKRFSFEGAKQPRGADLALPYDLYYSGVINGQVWYTKVRLAGEGSVAEAWGQQADGTFYELVSR